MNQTPEAIRARSEANAHFLYVVESMLDGDADDAHHHLRLWDERRRYALSFERKLTNENAVTPDQEECARLRLLCLEMWEHFVYSDKLPDHLRSKLSRAARPFEA